MKIGAGALVKQWGRAMSLSRDGEVLVDSFKGRKVELRPEDVPLDGSIDQHNFIIIGSVDEFNDVVPQKFDVVTQLSSGTEYTVQRSHEAGADEDELYKMHVRGGIV